MKEGNRNAIIVLEDAIKRIKDADEKGIVLFQYAITQNDDKETYRGSLSFSNDGS